MTGKTSERLEKLGITLPPAPAAQGNYVPYAITGNLVFLAGQIALVDGELQYAGRVTVSQSSLVFPNRTMAT